MSAPLGIIGGSAFLESAEVEGARPRDVDTPQGTVRVHEADGFCFLRRHGEGIYHPPHRIPHHAHVLAFEALGVREVAAFASTGSLHLDLKPGDVVVPDDYYSWHSPPTFAADDYLHVVPSLDPGIRELLAEAARAALEGHGRGPERATTLELGGVYAETRGPRFETAAESRMLSAHARIVGMTAASEATLFQERGIRYGVVCIVDNWANGIGSPPLTLEAFQQHLKVSGVLARRILGELLRIRAARA